MFPGGKLSGIHTGGQIQRTYVPKMTRERKGTWLKMEASRREAGNSPAPKARAAYCWLAHLKVTESKIRKTCALDLKQEKCPKLISIKEPQALFPHTISREHSRIMTLFGKQTQCLDVALVPMSIMFPVHKREHLYWSLWHQQTSVAGLSLGERRNLLKQ